MDSYIHSFALIVIVLLVSACGMSTRTTVPPQDSGNPNAYTVDRFDEIQASLMQAYRDWKGTPYLLGGASKNGVDCSTFISIVFDRYFGIDLPSNTRKQLYKGDGIRRASIRTGDLVFFNTGRRSMHAGIMVNSNEFVHASTSKGVIISDITADYWAGKYKAARRIF